MHTRKNRLWLLPIVILVCLFTLPTEVGSQCMVAYTVVNSGPPTTTVTKTLSAAYLCNATSMVNAWSCNPASMAMTPVNMLYATAMSATVAPFCNWVCACGNITIDGNDGLPVELMDFSIE